MRASLPAEVEAFVRLHGPSTAPAIALGVRARRVDVDSVLTGAGFSRAAKPEGASPRSVYFDVSERVPRLRAGKSRADVLAEILSDGGWHTRDEIFRLAGRFIHTNNAARELRSRDVNVEYDRAADAYRIVSFAEPGVPQTPPLPASGSANERKAA